MIGLESGSGEPVTFEGQIAQCVMNKLTDGTLEKLIEKAIEEAVSKGLDAIFSYRGEGKELIEKKLNETMLPVIERHDFNQYLIKLDEVLTSIVNQTNLADNKKILENFRECLTELQQKEIKLSEIFEKYCQHVADNVSTDDLEAYCDGDEHYYECVSANMEVEHEDKGWFKSSYDDCYVKFTCEEDKDLNCQIKLYKGTDEKEWKILRGLNGIEINSLRHMNSFEVFMSVIQRSYTKIIIDTESEYADDIQPTEKPE